MRGCSIEIHSENGTNFVDTNNKLKKVIRSLFTNKEEIDNYLANEAIKWHFNASSDQHFGGLWEAGI